MDGQTYTLGARDFSSAVSGFCQVFHARKTSGTQGIKPNITSQNKSWKQTSFKKFNKFNLSFADLSEA